MPLLIASLIKERIKRIPFAKSIFVSGLLASALLPFPASAQLGLSPLYLEEQVTRGRAQGVITLTNVTDAPIRARVYSEPFTYERSGFAQLSEDPADLSPYLQFSPREMVIPPGGEQRVRLLGLFPPDAPDKEYRAAVYAEELVDSTTAEDSPIALKLRVGSMVYMRNGDIAPRLVSASAQPLASENSVAQPQMLELLVNNQGGATTRVAADWQLYEGDEAIDAGSTTKHTVVAGSDRSLPLTLSRSLESGNYILRGELSWVTASEGYRQSFEVPVLVP